MVQFSFRDESVALANLLFSIMSAKHVILFTFPECFSFYNANEVQLQVLAGNASPAIKTPYIIDHTPQNTALSGLYNIKDRAYLQSGL